MQKGYVYCRTKPMGREFRPGFAPELTPKQMLALGVFGGKYMTDCRKEFPASWFARAKLSKDRQRAAVNYFGINASQPLEVWREKGWIHPDDPRGWFQWYCRYYSGRRHGRPAADQTLARGAAPRCAAKKTLRATRSDLPAPPTPGASSLGLRFDEDLRNSRKNFTTSGRR